MKGLLIGWTAPPIPSDDTGTLYIAGEASLVIGYPDLLPGDFVVPGGTRVPGNMTKTAPNDSRTRIRAGKACNRCSQRKIKCDAATYGLPCSRCRSDQINDCTLRASLRGTYDRKERALTGQRKAAQSERSTRLRDRANSSVSPALEDTQIYRYEGSNPPQHGWIIPASHQESTHSAAQVFETASQAFPSEVRMGSQEIQPAPGFSPASLPPSRVPDPSSYTPTTLTVVSEAPSTGNAHRSLPAMFEDFLRRQGVSSEGAMDKCGFVLLSETSPLTFALEGVQMSRPPEEETQPASGTTSPGHHPSHMRSEDIAYLQSEGAFDFPETSILDALVDAFVTRFCPLYSIVDLAGFNGLYKAQRVSPVLLNAVCLIGASFCDSAIIHQMSLSRRSDATQMSPDDRSDMPQKSLDSRSEARRAFYDRTKALFDLGYETNQLVLIQSALMMSFWGPHLKSYTNPSSWVDTATTIAASLGIHRDAGLTRFPTKDRGLLRRLWSTILSRDATCATLLGRPFRIRISQCDNAISPEDFPESLQGPSRSALYQIHSSRLSVVLRRIVLFHSNGPSTETQSSLRDELSKWKSELPPEIDWSRQDDPKNIFAISLKIMFHHHIILLFMGKAAHSAQINTPGGADTAIWDDQVISAAQTIASSALSLMITSKVTSMPHEVYTGFFISGVVFYRQLQRHGQSSLAQLHRSALDNCQVILNEARESCDAAKWMMRVFEFLLSSKEVTEDKGRFNPSRAGEQGDIVAQPAPDDMVDQPDWGLPTGQYDYGGLSDDFFAFLPDFYMPALGDFGYDM